MQFKIDLEGRMDKVLEHQLIEPRHGTYSAPASLVPQNNGKLRFAMDYRQLNKQTIKSCWPTPSNEAFFDTLEGSFYFSTIDMSWQFYQLPMEEASQNYTAFSAPFTHFKWLHKPMGFSGSPTKFQSLMEKELADVSRNFTIPHVDGCIIFSRTIEEHLQRLLEYFQRFKDANFKINAATCEFFRQKVPSFCALVQTVKASEPILRKVQLLTTPRYQRTLPMGKVCWASVHTIENRWKTLQK